VPSIIKILLIININRPLLLLYTKLLPLEELFVVIISERTNKK